MAESPFIPTSDELYYVLISIFEDLNKASLALARTTNEEQRKRTIEYIVQKQDRSKEILEYINKMGKTYVPTE